MRLAAFCFLAVWAAATAQDAGFPGDPGTEDPGAADPDAGVATAAHNVPAPPADIATVCGVDDPFSELRHGLPPTLPFPLA